MANTYTICEHADIFISGLLKLIIISIALIAACISSMLAAIYVIHKENVVTWLL